jgi:hypothetical protein
VCHDINISNICFCLVFHWPELILHLILHQTKELHNLENNMSKAAYLRNSFSYLLHKSSAERKYVVRRPSSVRLKIQPDLVLNCDSVTLHRPIQIRWRGTTTGGLPLNKVVSWSHGITICLYLQICNLISIDEDGTRTIQFFYSYVRLKTDKDIYYLIRLMKDKGLL